MLGFPKRAILPKTPPQTITEASPSEIDLLGLNSYLRFMAMLTLELPAREKQTPFNLSRWTELLADRELAKVEGRIETDRYGRIIMSPPSGSESWEFPIRDYLSAPERLANRPGVDRMPDLDRRRRKGSRRGLGVNQAHEGVGRTTVFSPRARYLCGSAVAGQHRGGDPREGGALFRRRRQGGLALRPRRRDELFQSR